MNRFLYACCLLFLLGACSKEDKLDMSLPEKIKTKLHEQIDHHRVQSYYSLWSHFRQTDERPDGYVNDIYDNGTHYTFGKDQQSSGSYHNKYNREHSFPKSWFGADSEDDNKAMYTDLFHLYPCDGEANSKRSNHPYGEIQGNASWSNGYCQLGRMSVSGYSGTVFEPHDDIKGNLARTYFYIATRYEDEDFSRWSGNNGMLTLSKYPFFKTWAVRLLLKWNELDPVDQHERKRNDEIEKIQGNRNPFIDDEELAEYIWGDKKGLPYN